MNFPIRLLHRVRPFRVLARRLFCGITLRQRFHGGTICLDAVEHSWAWTGNIRYETFDLPVQNLLLNLSMDHDLLVDLGANVGAMSLSVALRNPNISVLAVEPNRRATALLAHACRINRLTHRIQILNAVIAQHSGVINFDDTGSVIGHVSSIGVPVPALTPDELLRSISPTQSVLLKVDIEGFESVVLSSIAATLALRGGTALVELHPLGWNGVGDPHRCLACLRDSSATVLNEHLQPVDDVQATDFSYVIAQWSTERR